MSFSTSIIFMSSLDTFGRYGADMKDDVDVER